MPSKKLGNTLEETREHGEWARLHGLASKDRRALQSESALRARIRGTPCRDRRGVTNARLSQSRASDGATPTMEQGAAGPCRHRRPCFQLGHAAHRTAPLVRHPSHQARLSGEQHTANARFSRQALVVRGCVPLHRGAVSHLACLHAKGAFRLPQCLADNRMISSVCHGRLLSPIPLGQAHPVVEVQHVPDQQVQLRQHDFLSVWTFLLRSQRLPSVRGVHRPEAKGMWRRSDSTNQRTRNSLGRSGVARVRRLKGRGEVAAKLRSARRSVLPPHP